MFKNVGLSIASLLLQHLAIAQFIGVKEMWLLSIRSLVSLDSMKKILAVVDGERTTIIFPKGCNFWLFAVGFRHHMSVYRRHT